MGPECQKEVGEKVLLSPEVREKVLERAQTGRQAVQHWYSGEDKAERYFHVLLGRSCGFRSGTVLAPQMTVVITLERDVYMADKTIFKTQEGIF